jgi:MazG family protein
MAHASIEDLLHVMARLRDPEGGCPWDLEQTFATIAPYTIEEAYEVAEAIARDDMPDLVDELGDLLLQVVFHAQMAREAGHFGFADVVGAVVDKMVRRHPHVFGDAEVRDAAEQTLVWQSLKDAERVGRAAGELDDRPGSILDDVTGGLPALKRATKLQSRAARLGFDWRDARAVLPKVREELDEVETALDDGADQTKVAEEIGDLLFACVNLARQAGVDPDGALIGANAKFERRFRALEALASERGEEPARLGLDALEALWSAVKAAERPRPR